MVISGFGAKLRQLRDGESPTVVAAAVGVSVASIHNYEAGQLPRRATRRKLADYYGSTVEAIFGKEDTNDAEGN